MMDPLEGVDNADVQEETEEDLCMISNEDPKSSERASSSYLCGIRNGDLGGRVKLRQVGEEGVVRDP
jgi:hypothetical protein